MSKKLPMRREKARMLAVQLNQSPLNQSAIVITPIPPV